MAAMGIDDVREALKSFDGKHIPTEFAAREARMRAEHERALAAKNAGRKRRSASSGLGMLAGSLGMKPGQQVALEPGAPNISEALAEGRMLSDLVREDGMRRYRMMQKEIHENGEKWLKEEAEMEKKMQDEGFKDMKSKWFGLGGGAGAGGGGASTAAIHQQPPPPST
jgi:mitochondrial import inner membrane translocase subunit TIM50